MIQTEYVQRTLKRVAPDLRTKVIGITTTGDRSQSGGVLSNKGDFTTELETALLERRADIAVHSMKDIPAELHAGLSLQSIGNREDVRDALVARDPDFRLASGVSVGSSSQRRTALLKHYIPGLSVVPIRGNVETRIAKMDRGEVDALLLASAGVRRLGLESRVTQCMDPTVFVPAACQGVIALEYLSDRSEISGLVSESVHPETELVAQVERGVIQSTGSDCLTPIGVYCQIKDKNLQVHTAVLTPDGASIYRAVCTGATPREVIEETIEVLQSLGTGEILNFE